MTTTADGAPGATPEDPSERAAQALLDDLVRAVESAERTTGRTPVGVRAVEPARGRRLYLCAFEGPGFLCLGPDARPEGRASAVREAATVSLLWEHLETLVDADALRAMVGAIGRLLAVGGEPPAVTAHLERVAEHALVLAAWRDEPQRVLASLPALDDAVALQEEVAEWYGRYLVASEPLVEAQGSLAEPLVAALRALEERAAEAGARERLADRLAGAMPECDEAAGQVLQAHLTRLTD